MHDIRDKRNQPAPLLHSINDACRMLGDSGRNTVYNLINDGRLTMVKLGRRSFITHDSIVAFVESLKGENE